MSWSLYSSAFENRKIKLSHLPQIEGLIFSNNNSFAFAHLKQYYLSEYSKKLENNLTTIFPKAKFKTEDEVSHLYSFIKLLLASGRDDYKKIAIDKLKSDTDWKLKHGWFTTIFRKYGIEI